HHRQPAHELGDEAVLDEIDRLELLEQLGLAVRAPDDVGLEAHGLAPGAPGDDVLDADEGAAADEQDVGGIDLVELLVRVLPPTLRRDVGDGALEDLEQRLLDSLAGNVAGDRDVLGLAADLVDLVDIDDAALGLLDVVA